MRKDIPIAKIENVAVAVVQEFNEEKTDLIYNVYLINQQDQMIENVMVSSKGYGERKSTGESIKTSILRHFLGDIKPNSFYKIEPIIEEVFGINNEFWLSFYVGKTIFDKKYIFLAETIQPKNFIDIPLIEKKGVLIK